MYGIYLFIYLSSTKFNDKKIQKYTTRASSPAASREHAQAQEPLAATLGRPRRQSTGAGAGESAERENVVGCRTFAPQLWGVAYALGKKSVDGRREDGDGTV